MNELQQIEKDAQDAEEAMRPAARDRFVSSTGITVRVRPVKPLLASKAHQHIEMMARKLIVEELGADAFVQPTYTLETGDGQKEIHPHDDKSILSYPQQADHYRRYQEAAARLPAETGMRFNDFLIASCAIVEMPSDEVMAELIEMRQMFDLPVPTTPLQKKIAYMTDVVLGATDDFQNLMELATTVVGGEDVEAATRAFRRSIRQEPDPTGGPAAEETEPPMVDLAAVQRTNDSEGVGTDAEPVGQGAAALSRRDDGIRERNW